MSIDVEYALKKDIRNNPVVREIDLEQKREFRRTLVLAGLIVAMLLFSAWQHLKVVTSGYRMEVLRAQLAEQEATNRKLRLELEVWRRPQALEERATGALHMVAPTEKDTLVIERVQGATASKTIVASAR
jgi:exopolyphosphatase/pppGpp-phosphohydrolase